jgi:hypothetical protein
MLRSVSDADLRVISIPSASFADPSTPKHEKLRAISRPSTSFTDPSTPNIEKLHAIFKPSTAYLTEIYIVDRLVLKPNINNTKGVL